MNISTHTERVVFSFRHLNVDHIRKRFKILNGFHQDHIDKLDVQLLALLVPLQHIQNEAVGDCVVVNARSIIHVIDCGSLNLVREAYMRDLRVEYGAL